MTDSSDYRKYLDERFEGLAKVMSAEFINVHDKLDVIEKQTTRTNGRVTYLEADVVKINKDLFEHPVNCNKGKDIEEIKKFVDQNKFAKTARQRQFENILKVLGVIIALGMLLLALLKINEKADKVLTGQENLGMPFPITTTRGEPALFSDSLSLKYWPKDSSFVFIIKKVKNEY